VYGTPTQESDIDLVVLLDDDNMKKLTGLAEQIGGLGSPGGVHYEDGISLRFGRLNLLCVTSEKHFNVWLKGTEGLTKMKPVTRDFAIEHLKKLRSNNDIGGW